MLDTQDTFLSPSRAQVIRLHRWLTQTLGATGWPVVRMIGSLERLGLRTPACDHGRTYVVQADDDVVAYLVRTHRLEGLEEEHLLRLCDLDEEPHD